MLQQIPMLFHRKDQFLILLEETFLNHLVQLANEEIWLDSILDKISKVQMEYKSSLIFIISKNNSQFQKKHNNSKKYQSQKLDMFYLQKAIV